MKHVGIMTVVAIALLLSTAVAMPIRVQMYSEEDEYLRGTLVYSCTLSGAEGILMLYDYANGNQENTARIDGLKKGKEYVLLVVEVKP